MKKLVFITIILLIIFANFVYAKEFTDVDKSFWAYGPINQMLEEKILSGYPDGTFRPNNAITRAEFAKIMVLALDLKEDKDTKNVKFSDVDSDFWANDYIKIASKYLAGYEENGKKTYSPNQHAIRADVAVALVIATGLDNSSFKLSTLDAFKDKNSIPANYRRYIAIAVENNLMRGYDDGTFKPKASLTRAQVSQLIYNTKPIQKEETKEETTLEVGEDGFIFNKEDLSLDLGENWDKYIIGMYRASQRHLIYSSSSVGYQKYKDESQAKSERDENNREYSQYIDLYDYKNGHIPYTNVDTKETKYMDIPIAFDVSIPLNHFDNVSNEYEVSSSQIYEIKISTLNKIKESTATFFYENEYKDTIFKQYLNTNNIVVNPEFSKKDYMTLKVNILDIHGNAFIKYYYLFNKDLLKYENKYYPVISNGIFEENGIKKITFGSARASDIKDYVISRNCKIPEELLDGQMYNNWKPVIVCARINEKNEIVQLIALDDQEVIASGSKMQNTFYCGNTIYKVDANNVDGNFNLTVYATWDENKTDPIYTNLAESWTVRPTTNGSAAPKMQHDGFGVVARTYAFTYDTVDAWVVMDKNEEFAKYFLISNYGDEMPGSTIPASTTTPTPETPEEPSGEDNYYHSEELTFNKEDLTIDLGKDFENYEFTSYANTYKASQRVLVYNGYYENDKAIKCERSSDPNINSNGSRELLSFIGNESSKENKNVTLINKVTNQTTVISIPNPFRVTAKIKGQEIFSEYAKMYGDTEAKRNSVNLGNEKDKVSLEFDILNGLKEAKITFRNEGSQTPVEYTTTKKSFSVKLPEFTDSDIMYMQIKITDKNNNSGHVSYTIINKKIYELNCEFCSVTSYVISSKNTISLRKLSEEKPKDYKIANYLRMPDNLVKGTDGVSTICWVGIDKSNKVGLIIPLDKIGWRTSSFGAYYSGPKINEIGEIDVSQKIIYLKNDSKKENPIRLAEDFINIIKIELNYNDAQINLILNELSKGLLEKYLGFVIYDKDGKNIERMYFIDYPYVK